MDNRHWKMMVSVSASSIIRRKEGENHRENPLKTGNREDKTTISSATTTSGKSDYFLTLNTKRNFQNLFHAPLSLQK